MTVLTNSLPVISLVDGADAPQIDLIGIDGTFRKLTRSFVDAEAVRMVVDRIVFSARASSSRDSSPTPPP